ncbi:hypothetical protein [Maliponia aquimaris]|uniref:Uncharacterized protein n=1 Tax=Maliponia aquimaris TaxID=1673631 RepID=A0A238KKK2_9RHOB|nr:hypothetical protein [Maliponia aquimaris]SMX43303.1 hypothetical protein MAA8898_02792 [Maliponia aquimaris]
MHGVLDRDTRDKELLEYLRIYVMIWQKIDFIWGMFLTSYIPLFGFLHFYQGEIGVSFAGLFVLAIAVFTWVNAQALRQHYDMAITMSREFRRLNRSFPDLNGVLVRTAHDGRPRLVGFTHGFAFLGFLYMMLGRTGVWVCAAGTPESGWSCLVTLLLG